jgi:hypothetical protein
MVSILSGEDHKKQLVFAPLSLILANNILPINRALYAYEYSNSIDSNYILAVNSQLFNIHVLLCEA